MERNIYDIYEIILNKISRLPRVFFSKIINEVNFTCKAVSHKRGIHFDGIVIVKNSSHFPLLRVKNIYIGRNVRFNSCIRANPIGGLAHVILYTISSKGQIIIGDDVGLSGCAIVAAQCVEIGNRTMIGAGSKIYDTDFHSLLATDRQRQNLNVNSKKVRIGEDVFIGAHSIILKGVNIGNRAVVGAGSVVTKNIAEGEIWAGNPAKFIKKIDEKGNGTN